MCLHQSLDRKPESKGEVSVLVLRGLCQEEQATAAPSPAFLGLHSHIYCALPLSDGELGDKQARKPGLDGRTVLWSFSCRSGIQNSRYTELV